MSIVKVTWIFEQGNRGWTEGLVKQQSGDDLGPPLSQAISIGQKRAVLLGTQGQLKAIRVSLEQNAAGQSITGDALLNYQNIGGSLTQVSDAPDTALEVVFRTLNGTKRKIMFMRGIWDAIVDTGGNYNPTAGGWATSFNSWMAAVLANGFGWWGNDVSGVANVTDYDPNPPTLRPILLLDGNVFTGPFPKRYHVRIAGVNGKSVLNGPQIVSAIDASSCNLVKPLAVGPFQIEGTLSVYGPAFRGASDIQAGRIIERKAGAPLLVSRGRQRARART